jgi:pimeloyl-ACP methyl ester carboxylesterase
MIQIPQDTGSLAVCDWGQGRCAGRPTVLWLHGAGMDHTVWSLQARARRFHGANSLAPDLPQHGASGGRLCRSIAEMASVVGHILDGLAIERCDLVGHSMGALVALTIAATQPQRIGRLVLLGAATRMPVHPRLLEMAASDRARAGAMMAEWGIGSRARLTGTATPGVSLPMATRALVETSRPGALAADLAACNDYGDGEDHAAAVRCPTLVVSGRQDRMTPRRQGDRLAGLITGAATAHLATGHMIMLEAPKATLGVIADFLGST